MRLSLCAAVVFVLAAGAAWAQQPAEPSKYTCSFLKSRCDSGCESAQKAGQCRSNCQLQHNTCLQTGTWASTQSNTKTFTNVIKQ